MPFAAEGTYGGRVVVTPLDARRWRLLEPVAYTGERDHFLVPEGYVTDFASVPRLAVWLIPTYGRYTAPAILHDYLITDCIPTGRITSADTDGLFRRAMRELGVPPVRRWLMWAGVRWGALFNRRRRAGWARSAPGVLAITVLALPLALPMLVVLAGLAVYGLAEAIATGGRRKGTLST
jgi:hypothetical protein